MKDINLESSVLGDIIQNPHLFSEAVEILGPENFYSTRARLVFTEIMEMTIEGLEVELVSLAERLRGRVTATQLLEYTDASVGVLNFKNRCILVKEKWIARNLKDLGVRLSQKLGEQEDVLEVLTWTDNQIQEMFASTVQKTIEDNRGAFDSLLKRYEHVKKGGLLGLSTGLLDLDNTIYGWQNGLLYLIAARPSIGKSLFLANTGVHVAKLGVPVAFFSLEMSAEQLLGRIVCSELDISSTRFKRGKLTQQEEEKLKQSGDYFKSLPFYISESSDSTPAEILARSKKLIREKGVGMIMVDYLQLMSYPQAGNREQEISQIALRLKTMAKLLKVPVLVATQLNRAVELRDNKKPMLADLRESGAQEAHSDVCILLHRPEFYGINEFDDQLSSAGVAQLIVAKHRDGPTDSIYASFSGEYLRFANFQTTEYDI
jgi:replicative DNA helicase